MNGLPLSCALLLLAGPARSQDSGNKFDVLNRGKLVEITQTAEAEPGQKPAEPDTVLASTLTVSQLTALYTGAMREESKLPILERLGQTKPLSEDDLRWLLNLYARDSGAARPFVEASLARLAPTDERFAPLFLALLQDEDPFLQMFGLLGSFQLRSPSALPLIRALGQKRFSSPQPTLSTPPLEANRWRVQFQALRILAVWEGRKVLPLLEERAKEAPLLDELIASLYWDEYLPRIVSWAESSDPVQAQRGAAALRAAVPLDKLRLTLPALKKLVLDGGKKKETRHQAALKLGAACDDPCVQDLLKDYERASGSDTRLFLSAALFASRSPRAIPLLERTVKEDPLPAARAGALFQLREMLPKDKYAELLTWAAAHEKDAENRADAARQLASPQ